MCIGVGADECAGRSAAWKGYLGVRYFIIQISRKTLAAGFNGIKESGGFRAQF